MGTEYISTDEMSECILRFSFIYDSLCSLLSQYISLMTQADMKTREKLSVYIAELSVLDQKLFEWTENIRKAVENYNNTEEDITRMVRQRLFVPDGEMINGYIIAESDLKLSESLLLENKTLRHEMWIADQISDQS